MPQDDDSAKNDDTVLYRKVETVKSSSDKGAQGTNRKEIVVPEDFGRYRIVRELGRGNMGAVFLAHDKQLDRPVAIKIPFFSDDDKEVTGRFYREARSMATVQHPNLCPIYDVGQFERWHFLTMAYIDGEPLSKAISQSSGLPWRYALELLRTVSLALHKAHEAGLVHRDLKPSNIMLARDGQPTVMDFGLARRISANEAELTHSGAVFGSPAYMAPEQVEARHDEVGPSTDVYALGVILYEMVTGTTPFRGSVASVFGQIVSRIPELPSKYRPDLPVQIDRVCMQAMAKNPSERFASARAFAEALGPIIEHSADNPSAGYFDPWKTQLNRDVQETLTSASVRNRRDAELRQVTLGVFRCEEGDEQVIEGSSAELAYTQSEIMHGRFQSFAALAMEQIERFGGHLLLNNGVELIACWGYPQAHEDSPQRAVRASLQIAKMLTDSKDRFELLPKSEMYCAALHSGEAVVESVESSSGQSISLVGEVRTTALRLSALAEPGMVLISASTHHRTALFLECESLGPRRLRGTSQTIEVYRVLSESTSRNRVELVDPSNLTPLVGRDTELHILKDRWEQSLDDLGQIVLLIGDAGLGKSRLIRELREYVIQSHDPDGMQKAEPAVIEWRCSQYHQNTSYFPMVEFFSQLLELHRKSPQDRLETVVRYLRDIKLETADNVWLMCSILNIPTDQRYPPLALSPQKLKDRTETLLFDWLEHLAASRPVLFIVEDLHWLDPTTLEFLERFVLNYESSRVLCVLTFRPEFETPWKSKPHQTQIALNRLTKKQIGEMMLKRTNRKQIPEMVLQRVIDRTDGIPLFIEEFTVVIEESGLLDRLETDQDRSTLLDIIPVSLNDLLLSRLDRMDANQDVIQMAATIGREFPFGLLHATCNLSKDELQRELEKLVHSEILFQKGDGDRASFIFKHALLQDAAYRSILIRKRQLGHKRIAEVLETQFPDIASGQPSLLANHFTLAGMHEKGIEYWGKAGLRSQEQSANVEAIRNFKQGIELIEKLPESPHREALELNLKLPLSAVLMAVQGYASPEVEIVQNRCIEICRSLGDRAPLFPVLLANWVWLFVRGRFEDCYKRCPEVIAMAEATRGPGMMAEAHWTQVCTSFYAGDFPTTLKHAQIGWNHHEVESSIEYAKFTQQNSGPLNLSNLGLALWQLGYAQQGIAKVHEALQLSINLKHVFTQAVMEWMVAQVYEFALIGDKAVEYGKRCRQIGNEQAFAMWQGMGNGIIGIGLKQQGRYDEAVERLTEGISIIESTTARICMAKYKAHLADALWQNGQRSMALDKLEQAFESQKTGEYFTHAELLRFRGDFAYDSGQQDQAELHYNESLRVAIGQGAKFYELRTTSRLCRLWEQQGKRQLARQKLESLLSGFTEGFEMPDLQEARTLLVKLNRDN